MVAPTPMLLSAAIENRWSRGAQRIYVAARPAFTDAQLQLLLWPGGHAFTRPMQDAAYKFLEQHIGDSARVQDDKK